MSETRSIRFAKTPGETFDTFASKCEQESGVQGGIWLTAIRKFCHDCDTPLSFMPDPRLPTNISGNLTHHTHTFVFQLEYSRVRMTESPSDPNNSPRFVKLMFQEMFFLPQVHVFSDIPEYTMKHFQPAWGGKPVYVNHDYDEEPVGQHIAGFLSPIGGLPMNNDEESTYNGKPVKFMAFYSLAAIENTKIPWILQMLRATKLLDLDVSIGYVSRTHMDAEDTVRDKDGDEDMMRSLVYEKAHMPMEGSLVARGNGACPGATVIAVYGESGMLYDSETRRISKALTNDARKYLNMEWDLETSVSPEIVNIFHKLDRKGKVPVGLKQWFSRRGIRVFMALSPSEAAIPANQRSTKKTIGFLCLTKNPRKMSTENNGSNVVVPSGAPAPQAPTQPAPTTVVETTASVAPTAPVTEVAPAAPVGAKVFSTEPLEVMDVDGSMYTLQIPEIRSTMRRVMSDQLAGTVSEDVAEAQMFGLVAKDRREVKLKQYRENDRAKLAEGLAAKLGAKGFNLKDAKYRGWDQALDNPNNGELLKTLLEMASQPPVAPVVPPTTTVQMSAQAPAKPQASAPAQQRPAPSVRSGLGSVAGKTTTDLMNEVHREMAKEAEEATLKVAPARQAEFRFDPVDKVQKMVMPKEPTRRHERSLDKTMATVTAVRSSFRELDGETEREINHNLKTYGSFRNPNKSKVLPGMKRFGKLVNMVKPDFNPRKAIQEYANLGVGNIEDSPYMHSFSADEPMGITEDTDREFSFSMQGPGASAMTEENGK